MKLNSRSEILKSTSNNTSRDINRHTTKRKFERTTRERVNIQKEEINSFNNKKDLPNPSDDSYSELFPSLTDITEQSRKTIDISSNDYKNIAALLEETDSSLESVDLCKDCPQGWVSIYYKDGKRVTEYNKSRSQEEHEKKEQEREEEEEYYEMMKLYEEYENRRLKESEYAYSMGVIDHIVTTEELYEMFMEDEEEYDDDYNNELSDSTLYNQTDYLDDDIYEDYDDNNGYKYN